MFRLRNGYSLLSTIALILIVALMLSVVAIARHHDRQRIRDWQRREWRDRNWRDRDWRDRDWRDRDWRDFDRRGRDKKAMKFINGHDARDGRWDGKGPQWKKHRGQWQDDFDFNRRDSGYPRRRHR